MYCKSIIVLSILVQIAITSTPPKTHRTLPSGPAPAAPAGGWKPKTRRAAGACSRWSELTSRLGVKTSGLFFGLRGCPWSIKSSSSGKSEAFLGATPGLLEPIGVTFETGSTGRFHSRMEVKPKDTNVWNCLDVKAEVNSQCKRVTGKGVFSTCTRSIFPSPGVYICIICIYLLELTWIIA